MKKKNNLVHFFARDSENTGCGNRTFIADVAAYLQKEIARGLFVEMSRTYFLGAVFQSHFFSSNSLYLIFESP